jgi:carbonic anhydrase
MSERALPPWTLRPGRAGVLAALVLLVAGAAANPPQPQPTRQGGASETTAPGARAAARPDPKTASAGDESLEQLRQRLAGRLTGQSVRSDTKGPYGLKVVARTDPPAAAPPSARIVAPAARPAAPPPPTPAPATPITLAAEWAYQGDGAPAAWSRLKPEYKLCGNGQRQSPIDIRGGLAVDLEPVVFAWGDSRFGVIDSGRTVQANFAPGSHVEIGGRRFELLHLHFNRPSEHRIDGRQFEMSAHLVHRDAQGNLAIVALLFDRGPANAVVQTVWNNLPLEQGQEVPARAALPLQDLLPDDRRYFTYMGSLTTPPCTEGVRWVVMRQPVTLSAEQIELFARIYPMNARPVQQMAGRRILQSQ